MVLFRRPFVVLQVSAPYSRMVFTLELKRRYALCIARSLLLSRFFPKWQRLLGPCQSDAMTLSLPLLLSTMLPRYVNENTSARLVSLTLTGSWVLALDFSTLVFLVLMHRPVSASLVST